MSEPTNYPLAWPMGWKRTSALARKSASFSTKARGFQNRSLTVSDGASRIVAEIRGFTRTGRKWRIDPEAVIISTNLRPRLDGMPASGQREPDDPGAAVYFELDGKPMVLACDKWNRVADNLAAIAAHLGAIRGQERWGVGSMERAFTGYQTLRQPIHQMDPNRWWDVLGVERVANEDEVRKAWRALIVDNHPDRGGVPESAAVINAALSCAIRDIQEGVYVGK